MQWYLKVLKNYANFSGRARRKEYWMFALINFIIVMVFSLIEIAINGTDSDDISIFGIILSLYYLAVFIPSLAVAVRRLHDIGRSGWWLLISFVPLAGGIVLLVFTCLDSEGSNKYGPNPKNGNIAA